MENLALHNIIIKYFEHMKYNIQAILFYIFVKYLNAFLQPICSPDDMHPPIDENAQTRERRTYPFHVTYLNGSHKI